MSTTGLIIDIVLVAIVLIFGIVGYKKGLLKSIISLFSWVVCLIVALLLAKYVAGWINNIHNFGADIGGKISNALVNTNAEFFTKTIASFGGKENIVNNIPSSLNKMLANVIKVVFKHNNIDDASTDTVANVVGYTLGNFCMVIISAILIFIVLKIVLAILSKFFDNIERTKILGKVNKILGFALGVIKAGAIIVVLNFVLVGLSLVPVVNKTVKPLVQNNTHVEKFIYNKADDFVTDKVINGKLLQDWITGLWNSR